MELKSENPATMLELQTSYDRARSMLVTDGPVARSLLLSKPLEAKVGGVGHRGIDGFGRNVYASRQDPSYSALATWAAAVVATDGKAQQGAPGAAGMASGALAGAGAAGRR
jgi:hypothetical protein